MLAKPKFKIKKNPLNYAGARKGRWEGPRQSSNLSAVVTWQGDIEACAIGYIDNLIDTNDCLANSWRFCVTSLLSRHNEGWY